MGNQENNVSNELRDVPASVAKARKGIQLTPLSARPVVRYLFENKTLWRRKDLAAAVEKIHLQCGGVMGSQSAIQVVKKTLQYLNEEGFVSNVPMGFGIWQRCDAQNYLDKSEAKILGNDQSEDQEEDDTVVQNKIGEGAETIYLYYNPNDRKLAEYEKRDVWECKIGRSQGDPVGRILEQGIKTALSHTPVIGLVIHTHDSASLERALHASLRLADQAVVDSPGTEWFSTSPERVKDWYFSFKESMAILMSEKN